MKELSSFIIGLFLSSLAFTQPIDSVVVSVDSGYLYLEIPGWPHLGYTEEASEAQVEGDVILQFDLTENCSLENKKIAKGLGYGLDEMAAKVFGWIEDEIKENKMTKCPRREGFKLPITFTLKRRY